MLYQARIAGIKGHIPFYNGDLRIVEVIKHINFISELLTPKKEKDHIIWHSRKHLNLEGQPNNQSTSNLWIFICGDV